MHALIDLVSGAAPLTALADITGWLLPVGTIFVIVAVVLTAIFVVFKGFYRKVDQGQALIVNTLSSKPHVSFTGHLVWPIIHRAEVMDISVRTIEVDRRGANGLICRDKIRADVQVAFYVRVNKTDSDVLTVASAVGVTRASDKRTLEELFMAKFSEALKTVGMKMEFEELYNERQRFKEAIIDVIGKDLNGYVLEDTAIDYLEQTPVASLDPDNVFDAKGIEKITALTAEQKVLANEIRRQTEKKIEKQDTEAAEAIFALQRQRAEAEAVQQREIAVVQARERAEVEKIQFEEHKRSEEARILADQELGIQRENAQRDIQVAGKNRERAIAVETERVEKERQLEIISRERAAELARIEKEKALEVERKAIADVIRERVAVEKTVAQEEERIKDLRATMQADRLKQVAVTAATQGAEEAKIKQVTAAAAAEAAAVHRAKEQIALAEADQTAAEKQALAAIRRAEGEQATQAAEGMAAAKVTAERGRADASAIEQKLSAEAKGIAEKAESMKLLNESTKGHEEFRLQIEKEIQIEKARIEGSIAVAHKNAETLSQALKNARFDIVGGDGAFFDRFVKAISFGKSLDGALDRSETLQLAGREYLENGRSLPDDLKEVLTKGRFGTGDVKNLAATALLAKIAQGKDPKQIAELVEKAKELGFGDEIAGWLSGGDGKA